MEKITIEASDGLKLSCLYSKASKPKGIVQIVHGMLEHKERYIPLIEKLNSIGLIVIISDLRGHGESINDEYPLGFTGTPDELVDDQVLISKYAKKHNPHQPLYMFAHSMGSLIARRYLEQNDHEITKLILCGTVGRVNGVGLGAFIAGLKCIGSGNYKSSKLLYRFSNNMSAEHDISWISYNEKNLEAYKNDPLCNISFRNESYKALYKMVANLSKKKRYECKNPALKILSISGEDDRTTLGTEGVKHSMLYLMRAGYSEMQFIEYPHMKHEILNEENPEQVYQDILAFFGE